MISSAQIVNAIRRTQYSYTVPSIKPVSNPHLQAGSQNTFFESKPREEKGKKFSEIFQDNLKN